MSVAGVTTVVSSWSNPQSSSPDRQASTLVVVKPRPLTSELFAQDAVLFLEMVDDILLALV
jgi:hypothetical protein